MPFRVNRRGGIYKSGTAFSLQKRLQVIKSAILAGSIADAARENHVSYSTAWRIVRKYQQQLNCHAAVGGHFQKEVMKDFAQLYIELLVVVDPTIYLTEIQERLASDLGLQNDKVPSTATISHFLLSQNIMRKKCKKVASERFTPENIARRKAFIQWCSSVDLRKIFVVDETGILKTFTEILGETILVFLFHN